MAIAARGAEGRGAQGPSWRWGGSVSFAAPVPSGKWGLVTALPAGSPAPRLAASAVPLPALSPRSGGKKRAGGFLPAAWGDVCGEVSAISGDVCQAAKRRGGMRVPPLETVLQARGESPPLRAPSCGDLRCPRPASPPRLPPHLPCPAPGRADREGEAASPFVVRRAGGSVGTDGRSGAGSPGIRAGGAG